ncbi:MAG: Phage major capsid protein, HK97 family [Parcubacteria bacterium 32_520]|nr:MAG: Phage major capsid protein, HK97 family [Parcubacteria bacterium 32_520]
MDEKELNELTEVLQKALEENRDGIVAEATERAIEAMKDKGIDLNKGSNFPEKCVLNTDARTRSKAPFVAISEEVDNFAKDFKTIVKATKVGTNFNIDSLINQKAFNESSDEDGGYFVPDEVGEEIIRFMEENSVIRGRATVRTTTGNRRAFNKLDQSTNSFGGIQLYVVPESGEITESKAKIGKVMLQLVKIVGLTTITDELTQDNNVGLVNFITTLFGEAMAHFEDQLFINGTGEGEPMGILNSALTETVSRETPGTVSVKDLLDMDSKIPDHLSDGLVWLMRKSTYNSLIGKRASVYNGTTTVETGEFLITKDITGEGPGNMLGYPIVKTDKVSVLGNPGDVILANLRGYAILDKAGGGISITISIHTRFKYDETQMRFIKRVDGQPIAEKAFVKLV